ncbi:uncharacterized protein LOC134461506 [Engraulis encrasicolus]|uniref:uncharacterized protein LOC134461506 n=1 Tax=Engraulis encrasicolus TaxID=184585 RepID=UPI002FD466A6
MDRDRIVRVMHGLVVTYMVYNRSTMLALLLVLEEMGRVERSLSNISPSPLRYLGQPMPQVNRSCWMRVRSKDWWERVVLLEFDDEEWRQNFRMCRRAFMDLCEMVPYMEPADNPVRPPIPLVMRVAIVIYKLGSCCEYRVVANQFGVHKATVIKFMTLFCKGMVESGVMNKFIKVPSVEEARRTAREFKAKYHLPQVIGCIDGTHIPIHPPTDGYRDFVNRKGWPSYVLQAVVDNRHCFWNINCKMPGSAHDANVLKQSTLFKKSHQLPKVGSIKATSSLHDDRS